MDERSGTLSLRNINKESGKYGGEGNHGGNLEYRRIQATTVGGRRKPH
jgi:hypothetical protein